MAKIPLLDYRRTPEAIDRVYFNRKSWLVPQQISSLFSDPRRKDRIKMFGEQVFKKATLNSFEKNLSNYVQGKVKLVINEVVNFTIDGDSLDDIIKISHQLEKN